MGRIEGERYVIPVTIAGSASLSDEIHIGGAKMVAIQMDTTWTAAAITFKAASEKGGTYYDVYDDDMDEVSIAAPTASKAISCVNIAVALSPYEWIKIRSGTTASAVNQAAARTLYLICKA